MAITNQYGISYSFNISQYLSQYYWTKGKAPLQVSNYIHFQPGHGERKQTDVHRWSSLSEKLEWSSPRVFEARYRATWSHCHLYSTSAHCDTKTKLIVCYGPTMKELLALNFPPSYTNNQNNVRNCIDAQQNKRKSQI